MAKSNIEWTDYTFNPWEGCVKISRDKRFHKGEHWGATAPRKFHGDAYWRQPVKWNREAEQAGEKRRVFCGSLMDIFEVHLDSTVSEEQAEARKRLGRLISETPNLVWMFLTKRIENWREPFEQMGFWEGYLDRSWVGVTLEHADYLDRLDELKTVPVAVQFVSMEPLLGPVDLGASLSWIDWVIAGGESGAKARPSHPDWFRSLRDECVAAGVAFFFKQWGEWAPGEHVPDNRAYPTQSYFKNGWTQCPDDWVEEQDNGPIMYRVGKKAAGRLLEAREWNEVPALLVG